MPLAAIEPVLENRVSMVEERSQDDWKWWETRLNVISDKSFYENFETHGI